MPFYVGKTTLSHPLPVDNDSNLSDISPRDVAWDEHRASADEVKALYEHAEFNRYAERIQFCSRWLGFVQGDQAEGRIKLKLQSAKFCRLRHCPVCQWRRSLMWRARFLACLPRVTERYPTHRWLFLTLTIRNCQLEDLRANLTQMNKGWHRLTQRARWPGTGCVRSLEITRSVDGSVHPHFHCLILVPSSYFTRKYIPQAEWTELWKQALRVDYTPIVHVTAIKAKANSSATDQLTKAVLETLKYSVKVTDLVSDAAFLAELTKQVHKTRAISVSGVLREFLSEDDPEDLVNPEGEQDDELLAEEGKLWFTWRELRKRYVKANIE